MNHKYIQPVKTAA